MGRSWDRLIFMREILMSSWYWTDSFSNKSSRMLIRLSICFSKGIVLNLDNGYYVEDDILIPNIQTKLFWYTCTCTWSHISITNSYTSLINCDISSQKHVVVIIDKIISIKTEKEHFAKCTKLQDRKPLFCLNNERSEINVRWLIEHHS